MIDPIRFAGSMQMVGIRLKLRGIDGKFVLFELDGKTGRISYRLESNRVKKGSEHTLHVVVYDMCGNEQSYTNSFVW